MTGLQVKRFAAMTLLFMTVACGGGSSDSNNPVAPSGGSDAPADTPGITNNTDDFRFNLPGVTNYSTNGGYTWKNTGTTATVTQSNSISAGSGTLTIRDAGGRIVYSGNLGSGSSTTEAGPAGDWRIELAPAGVSGTISFRVQKN